MIVGLYGRLKSCMPTNAIDVNVQVKGFCDVELLLSASRRAKSRFVRKCGASSHTMPSDWTHKMPSILPFWVT
jgi:hypothetical protein